VQGNLDPLRLAVGAADGGAGQQIIAAFRDRPHVFNLGHGIVPETPIAHVARLVEIVKGALSDGMGQGAPHHFGHRLDGGLLYLPRLVYHADAEKALQETFKAMERRLYRAITTPAMIAAWVFGLWLAFGFGVVDFGQGWMWLKALLVIVLSGFHGFLGRELRAFSNDANTRPSRFFRAINEIPTLIMIAVVIAVVVKPFWF
jgi:putative membrane protein